MRICIDPGHGGKDPGAIALHGIDSIHTFEKDLNLNIALQLEMILKANHTVLMTRRTNRTLSLTARSDFANRNNADLFVSIHCNAASDKTVEGIEIYHFEGSEQGGNLAYQIKFIMNNSFYDHKDRGVKAANFSVLRKTLMPATLVECEFMTNPQQLEFIMNSYGSIATAIAKGIENYIAEKGGE